MSDMRTVVAYQGTSIEGKLGPENTAEVDAEINAEGGVADVCDGVKQISKVAHVQNNSTAV